MELSRLVRKKEGKEKNEEAENKTKEKKWNSKFRGFWFVKAKNRETRNSGINFSPTEELTAGS